MRASVQFSICGFQSSIFGGWEAEVGAGNGVARTVPVRNGVSKQLDFQASVWGRGSLGGSGSLGLRTRTGTVRTTSGRFARTGGLGPGPNYALRAEHLNLMRTGASALRLNLMRTRASALRFE